MHITRTTNPNILLLNQCITIQSSYQTKLGRSILNDALISPPSVESLQKTQNDYEKNVIKCEDQMYVPSCHFFFVVQSLFYSFIHQERIHGFHNAIFL
jgi:hypothetical protein